MYGKPYQFEITAGQTDVTINKNANDVTVYKITNKTEFKLEGEEQPQKSKVFFILTFFLQNRVVILSCHGNLLVGYENKFLKLEK
jgi:hypothetical protein